MWHKFCPFLECLKRIGCGESKMSLWWCWSTEKIITIKTHQPCLQINNHIFHVISALESYQRNVTLLALQFHFTEYVIDLGIRVYPRRTPRKQQWRYRSWTSLWLFPSRFHRSDNLYPLISYLSINLNIQILY